MITDGWVRKRLSDIADNKAGRTPARANAAYWTNTADGTPWVAISDMVAFGIVTTTKEKISKEAFEQVFRGQVIPAGTLIMSFKLTIGRTATLGIDACHNEAIISIYPRHGVDQRFLGYYLGQVDYGALQDRQVKGNTLNQEKLDRIEVPLPPIAEQSAIADVLESVRQGIELQRQCLDLAQQLKRAAMRQLFTRGLRGEPQKETEIGRVPESWHPLLISDLGTIVTGSTPPTMNPTNYVDGDISFIAPGDIKHGCAITSTAKRITQAGLRTTRAIGQGATCFVCIGSTIGKVGYTTVPICATNQQINSIIPSERFDPKFVFYLMTYLALHVRKQASPSPVPILSKGAFERIEIYCSLDRTEQAGIAAELSTIDCKIDLHRRKRAVLDDLFKTLLHKLMTGEIRVTDLDLSALSPNASEPAAA